MNGKFWRDQKPKENFGGTEIKCGIFRETIYLFNPKIYSINISPFLIYLDIFV